MARPWRNWARNQLAVPAEVLRPRTEDELSHAVSRGVAERKKVKAVGSGHSFTDIACTDGMLLDLGALDQVQQVDHERHRVTVGAGVVLRDLNKMLSEHDLALPNLGDIDAQTIAGATATGTHGTGAAKQCISAAIVGARLATGDGSMLEVSDSQRPDLLPSVAVGLGALGVLSAITLQCEPAFNLHAVESTHELDEVLDTFDAVADNNDHAEFFWFPHTRTAHLKCHNRTTEPVARRSKASMLLSDELLNNVAFGLLNRVGRRAPRAIPAMISGAVKPGDHVEYVAPSHEVFCSARRVRFVEMEYAIPRADLLEAFGRVRTLIDELGLRLGFPIEVRVLGGDETALGTASGRASAYIAVHVYRGTSHEAYFAGVERIMADYGGRPHWGKLHRHSAQTLAPLYPQWDAFQAALAELDPDGHFTNPYLNRVLRPSDFVPR